MSVLRHSRYLYWLLRELVAKYTRSLAFGFLIGLIVSIVFWRAYPLIYSLWLTPVERIGVIGEFTPSTLPLYIQELMSKGLTEISPDGTVLPSLASEWEATSSGKDFVFTFTLKSDATWHNGKPVVASDINYNIRNVDLIATSEHTLQATLKDPYSPFPTLVSKPILQAGLRGFGDYKVASIRLKGDKVQYLKLVPVSTPNTKNIEYRFYKTESIAALAYQAGEIDSLEDLSSANLLSNLGKSKPLKNTRYDRIVTVFFNMNNEFLKERPARQALAYAIPEFPYEKAYTSISKTSWAFTDRVRKFTYDPAQSKKLLSGANIAPDSVQLTISTFSQYLDTAQAIADSWTAIGVPTSVRVVNEVEQDYQVLLTAQEVPPDPDQYPLWHSTQHATNITKYINVKIDKLLEDGRQELDAEKRKVIYQDFQRRLAEDLPAIFLFYPEVYAVHRN